MSTFTRGHCLCGAVQLQAPLPARWVAHCHCTMCQRAHGAGVVTWAGFDEAAVQVDDAQGQLRWYASSPEARRAHCGRCGTPMLFASSRWPGELHLARALLDEALTQPPAAHVFHDTHVDWLMLGDTLPRHAATDST
ncbi:GFA family protein [Ideonella sp. 4Y11]|uniref:GFA family protein n=1 Tax=Ideonella aquatica TaxID=2824119 RepID=A0A941BFP3_9BURK|nr:GFA family protein [Ideonella aquatica]MBQ0958976.1 GFA family protein [Ideonella aquatica]